jgi:hypothetical protein
MCPRVLWNTNEIAVLTGRSMDWPESTQPEIVAFPRGRRRELTASPSTIWVRMDALDLSSGAPPQAVHPCDPSLSGEVTDRFAPCDIGF